MIRKTGKIEAPVAAEDSCSTSMSSGSSMGYLAPSGIDSEHRSKEPLPPQRLSWAQATGTSIEDTSDGATRNFVSLCKPGIRSNQVLQYKPHSVSSGDPDRQWRLRSPIFKPAMQRLISPSYHLFLWLTLPKGKRTSPWPWSCYES